MALQAFQTAARLVSFTAAARLLCLTPGAISRQVRILEGELGTTLLRRDDMALPEKGAMSVGTQP